MKTAVFFDAKFCGAVGNIQAILAQHGGKNAQVSSVRSSSARVEIARGWKHADILKREREGKRRNEAQLVLATCFPPPPILCIIIN
jgi:hypothetical protein